MENNQTNPQDPTQMNNTNAGAATPAPTQAQAPMPQHQGVPGSAPVDPASVAPAPVAENDVTENAAVLPPAPASGQTAPAAADVNMGASATMDAHAPAQHENEAHVEPQTHVEPTSQASVSEAPASMQEPTQSVTPATAASHTPAEPSVNAVESTPATPVEATVPAQPNINEPAAAQATPPQPTPTDDVPLTANPAAMQKNKDTKILVVEDEIDARTMFVDLLNSEGYETSSAVDGVDALAKAAADQYHLILLDIVMPNKDGIEVLQEIKNNPDKYGTPIVVMLTNISGDAAIEKAMEVGAAGFRLKVDVEPTELLKDVRDFLAGKVQNLEEEPVTRPRA